MIKILKNKAGILTVVIVLAIYSFYKYGNTFLPIEELAIPSAIGGDLVETDGDKKYKISISVYNYKQSGEIGRLVFSGTGDTIGATRESRQLKSAGKFLIGLERTLVLGQDLAQNGIRELLDILFNNRTVNDTSYVAVCKGESENILNFDIEGYPSSGDYIKNMIKHSIEYTFFPNNYRIIDLYARLDAEGRNIVLPYIEIKNGQLQITGMALFKDDKMIEKINIDEVKALNLLRENNVRGIINVQKNPEDYTDFYVTSKRKVKCSRVGEQYYFEIELDLAGELVSNNLYDNFSENPENLKAAEKDLQSKVEKMCNEFIKKMQNDYRVDCLEIGRYAAAKYGREKNQNWDEIVSNSKIIVSAKVKITDIGRGDY